MRLIMYYNVIVNYIMNKIHENICKYGTYYYPATKHYGNNCTGVECDRCYKVKLDACIGWENYDMCLICVSVVTNMIKNKSIKPEITFPALTENNNVTLMVQDQFGPFNDMNTYMMQDQFKNYQDEYDVKYAKKMYQEQKINPYDIGNLTFMMQDKYQIQNRDLNIRPHRPLTRMVQDMYYQNKKDKK